VIEISAHNWARLGEDPGDEILALFGYGAQTRKSGAVPYVTWNRNDLGSALQKGLEAV
jgi:hypothetical protein